MPILAAPRVRAREVLSRSFAVAARFGPRLLPLALCLSMAGFSLPVQPQEVIVHADVPRRTLSQNEARLLFTLRLRQWAEDRSVQVFVLADDNPLHIAFVKDVLALFPYQLRRVWDRQIFSGTGQGPIAVADEQEMIQRVATTPGAIGYVQSAVQDPRVRILEVR